MSNKFKYILCLSLIGVFIITNVIVYSNYFATSVILTIFMIVMFVISLLLNGFKKIEKIRLFISIFISLSVTLLFIWSQKIFGFSLNRLMILVFIISLDLYLFVSIRMEINNLNWATGFIIINILVVIFYMVIVSPLPKNEINTILIENSFDYENIGFTSKIRIINDNFEDNQENVGYYVVYNEFGDKVYVGCTTSVILQN
jgi:hypothetical protein